ncbi:hypothetical protein, partial [Nocardioides kribbensis]|uniref:hypothetical protein n=1 Tax=Nocardioides kribbensis TaxID=305517 RepID=UPI0032DAF820
MSTTSPRRASDADTPPDQEAGRRPDQRAGRNSGPAAAGHASEARPGPLGRLGVWVTDHASLVTGVWLLLVVGL